MLSHFSERSGTKILLRFKNVFSRFSTSVFVETYLTLLNFRHCSLHESLQGQRGDSTDGLAVAPVHISDTTAASLLPSRHLKRFRLNSFIPLASVCISEYVCIVLAVH